MTPALRLRQLMNSYSWDSHYSSYERLRSLSSTDQHHVLRLHGSGSGAITERAEIELRDGLDNLLGVVELIEIAITARYLIPPPHAVFEPLLQLLNNEALLTYYSKTYRLPLVVRLRNRLYKIPGPVEDDREQAESLFLDFTDLISPIEADPDVSVFLHFLDDYWFDGVGLPTLIKALNSPRLFVASYTTKKGRQEPLGKGLHGLRKFLDFCVDFDELLHSDSSLQQLRAAMRSHYAYWFDRLERGGNLEAFVIAAGKQFLDSAGKKPLGAQTRTLAMVINRLVDSKLSDRI